MLGLSDNAEVSLVAERVRRLFAQKKASKHEMYDQPLTESLNVSSEQS